MLSGLKKLFGHKPTPLEVELQRQREALRAIDKFVASINNCLKYWDRSSRIIRSTTTVYFCDKPVYQRPVDDISVALDSLKTISASVRPQLAVIKSANRCAIKSVARVEKATSRKRNAEKRLKKKEDKLRKLALKVQDSNDPEETHTLKAAEDAVQLARNNLQLADAELSRELQQTLSGSAPEAAMQVVRALEVLLLFLVGSGVDTEAIRHSMRALEATPLALSVPSPSSTSLAQLQHQMQSQHMQQMQSQHMQHVERLHSQQQQMQAQQQQQQSSQANEPPRSADSTRQIYVGAASASGGQPTAQSGASNQECMSAPESENCYMRKADSQAECSTQPPRPNDRGQPPSPTNPFASD